MLTKKSGAWRLRWGVVALTAVVPFALPAAASADPGPGAAAESIQYVNVAVNPPTGTQAVYDDNFADASSATNGYTPFRFAYKLWNTDAPIVNADNYAEADVSSCANCGATAIAFQVVLVSKQTLAELNADDAALGTTSACTSCNSLAESFQIVYATDEWSQLGAYVGWASDGIAAKLRSLGNSGLSDAQIQSQSTSIVNFFICLLQDSSGGPSNMFGYGAYSYTPAISCANNPSGLVSGTQPAIDLLSEIQQ